MAHLTIDTRRRGRSAGYLASHFSGLPAALSRWISRRRISRTVASELGQYSEQEISELGISRADIEFIANDAAER